MAGTKLLSRQSHLRFLELRISISRSIVSSDQKLDPASSHRRYIIRVPNAKARRRRRRRSLSLDRSASRLANLLWRGVERVVADTSGNYLVFLSRISPVSRRRGTREPRSRSPYCTQNAFRPAAHDRLFRLLVPSYDPVSVTRW